MSANFEIWQDGIRVAATFGPRRRAYLDAMRYYFQYAQDGPAEICERSGRKRIKIDPKTAWFPGGSIAQRIAATKADTRDAGLDGDGG